MSDIVKSENLKKLIIEIRGQSVLLKSDVVETYADFKKLKRDIGFTPNTPLVEGIARWAAWYKNYMGLQ